MTARPAPPASLATAGGIPFFAAVTLALAAEPQPWQRPKRGRRPKHPPPLDPFDISDLPAPTKRALGLRTFADPDDFLPEDYIQQLRNECRAGRCPVRICQNPSAISGPSYPPACSICSACACFDHALVTTPAADPSAPAPQPAAELFLRSSFCRWYIRLNCPLFNDSRLRAVHEEQKRKWRELKTRQKVKKQEKDDKKLEKLAKLKKRKELARATKEDAAPSEQAPDPRDAPPAPATATAGRTDPGRVRLRLPGRPLASSAPDLRPPVAPTPLGPLCHCGASSIRRTVSLRGISTDAWCCARDRFPDRCSFNVHYTSPHDSLAGSDEDFMHLQHNDDEYLHEGPRDSPPSPWGPGPTDEAAGTSENSQTPSSYGV